MNWYSKTVLTVIALLLAIIAFRQQPSKVEGISWGSSTPPPTYGDFLICVR
jgi:hypothetical protein